MLYFDTSLVGVGEASTMRQAKINCAAMALDNLKEGKTVPKPCSKDGK